MLEMTPLFLCLCSDHGGWSLFKLRVCICIFYYVWTLIFEARHAAPDFIWQCVISGPPGLLHSGVKARKSQKKGAGTDGSRHKSMHFSVDCQGWRCGLNALNACMEVKCACKEKKKLCR